MHRLEILAFIALENINPHGYFPVAWQQIRKFFTANYEHNEICEQEEQFDVLIFSCRMKAMTSM
jgi:hypothetical protein